VSLVGTADAVSALARAFSLGKPTLASENDRNSSHRKSIDNTTSTTYDKPPSCVSIPGIYRSTSVVATLALFAPSVPHPARGVGSQLLMFRHS
jgi:hypothetical protein